MMATMVYVLCTLTSGLCAVLLLREYRRTATRLLLWAGLSFAALAIANALVFADLVLFRDIDLGLVRAGVSCAAVCLLLYGLIWEMD